MPYLVLERLMAAQHVNAALRQFQGAARFPGLGVSASADRAPYHDERRVAIEVNIGPGERPEFLGPRTGEQRHDDVGTPSPALTTENGTATASRSRRHPQQRLADGAPRRTR